MLRRAVGRIPHVCIVGAGAAGLRCADILTQSGVKVTILEGRDRVGGRLAQNNDLGHLVDLGPNWIHGTDDNPILNLAKETGTMVMNWDGRQAIFDQFGHVVPEKEAAENVELIWNVIDEGMHYSNEHTATIPANKSLADYFRDRARELFPSNPESMDEVNRKRDMFLNMSEMWGSFVGSPIQRQSLKFFWLEECIDGENLFVADTYYKVLHRIAKPVLRKADIRLREKVLKARSAGNQDEPSVTVELESGETLTFDEVVMTTPLGWLKRNQDAFDPPLPSRLGEAIDAIGYGHLDKVYIRFPYAFWNELPEKPTTIPNGVHPETTNVTATTAPHHQSSSDQPTVSPNHYPGFTHWTSPHYADSTNPHHWSQECVNLAAVPAPAAHPTLLFYTFGPTSLHIASQLRQTPANTTEGQAFLFDFFRPYFSRLPNYSASNPACHPMKALATEWANDELAGYGSYCNFQIGLENGDKDIEVMRHGAPERGVWFAGEHTAPFVSLGTITGAYWAGEGVGRRIVRAYGLGVDKGVGQNEGVQIEKDERVEKEETGVKQMVNGVQSNGSLGAKGKAGTTNGIQKEANVAELEI